jgi:glutamine cyclotransferase
MQSLAIVFRKGIRARHYTGKDIDCQRNPELPFAARAFAAEQFNLLSRTMNLILNLKTYLAVLLLLPLLSLSCGENKIQKEIAPKINKNLVHADGKKKAAHEKKAKREKLNRDADYEIELIRTFPHNRESYTQGLFYYEGMLYESNGLANKSSLQLIDPFSSDVKKYTKVLPPYFAEGIALHGDKIYQLTWRSETCFVYGRESFQQENSFAYAGEGWGITNLGDNFIMSDGSNRLKLIDPEDFAIAGDIFVFEEDGDPLFAINELEYVRGEIFANIYGKTKIARISPEDGKVIGWIDCSKLMDMIDDKSKLDVFNGIAYDEEKDVLYLTGKYWPFFYEVKLAEKK